MKFKYYLRGAGIGIIVTTIILSAASLFQDNMSDAEIIQRAMDLGMVMEEGSSGTLADMPGQEGQSSNANTTPDDGQNASDDSQPSASDDDRTSTSDDGQSIVSDDGQNTDDPADAPDSGQSTDSTGSAEGPDGTDAQGDGAAQPGTPAEDGKDAGDGGDHTGQEKDRTQSADRKKQDEEEKKITLKVEGGDVSRAVSQRAFEAGLVSNADEFNQYLGDNGYANFLQPGTYHIKKGATFEQIAEILTNK